MIYKTGQTSIDASVHLYGINIFTSLRLSDCWADVDQTWHVYSMGRGTKLLRSGILNFAPAPRRASPNLPLPKCEIHHAVYYPHYSHRVCGGRRCSGSSVHLDPVCRRRISRNETTAAIRVEPLVGGGSLVVPTGQRLRVD